MGGWVSGRVLNISRADVAGTEPVWLGHTSPVVIAYGLLRQSSERWMTAR